MKIKFLSIATLLTVILSANTAFSAPVTASDRLRETADRIGAEKFTARNYHPGLIRHIVLFRYTDTVTPRQKEEVKARFLALKDLCRRSGKRYVVSIETGAQNSGEGVDQNLEQGFIVTFRSEGDRNFYVGKDIVKDERFIDPAHDEFKKFVGSLLHEPVNPTGVLVFDFTVEAPL